MYQPSPSGPSFADIETAYNRIAPFVRRTPLLSSPLLSKEFGREIYVKPECLQITSSFKIRGATHKIGKLSAQQLRRGVVAFSSGNHAQAVTVAAQRLDAPADIVMPEDAPQIKIAQTRAWGGQVRLYNRYRENRAKIAASIAADKGRVLIPPYDDEEIIAGQGSVGYEIIEDCQALGLRPACVLVPCGGGGLTAGIAIAMAHAYQDCPIFIAEPCGYDDTLRSLRAGEPVSVDSQQSSLCDALLVERPGELTFAVNRHLVNGGFAVDDKQVRTGMRCAFRHFRLVVEPGGAAALAVAIEHAADLPQDGATIVVLSGGNVDSELYRALIAD